MGKEEGDSRYEDQALAKLLNHLQQRVLDVIDDPEECLKENQAGILLWTSIALFVLFVYHLTSDGNFSFYLTFGATLTLFALCITLYKIWKQKSAAGISLKTLVLYAFVFALRLCSILVYEGYLPFDASGDYFYPGVEITSLLVTLAAIYLTAVHFRSTYQEKVCCSGVLSSLAGEIYIRCEIEEENGLTFLMDATPR